MAILVVNKSWRTLMDPDWVKRFQKRQLKYRNPGNFCVEIFLCVKCHAKSIHVKKFSQSLIILLTFSCVQLCVLKIFCVFNFSTKIFSNEISPKLMVHALHITRQHSIMTNSLSLWKTYVMLEGHSQQPVNEQVFPTVINSCSPRAYMDPAATPTQPSLSPICTFIT